MKRLALLLSLLPAFGQAMEIQPVVNADLRGGYAATLDGSSSGLALANISAVPALKFDNYSLLPITFFNSGGQQRPISEGTTFVRTFQLGFKPTLRRELNHGNAVSWRVGAQRNWNQETLGEDFGKGFYDYEEFGTGLGFDLAPAILGFGLNLGIDFAHRGYPNQHASNAAASLTNDKNYYIKDFYSSAGAIGLGFEFHNLYVSYRPEIRNYTDSYVVLKGGTLDLGLLQQDFLHSFDASLSFAPAETLGLNLNFNLSLNDSNQASFDLVGLQFIPDVQDYMVESVSLGLPWKADSFWAGLTLTPGYGLLLRQTQKPVQTKAGAYLTDKQSDTEHSLRLDAAKTLPGGWNWVSGGLYKVVSSNQMLVRGSLNSFQYFQVSTGFSYAFGGSNGENNPAAEPGMEDPEFNEKVEAPLNPTPAPQK